MNFYTSNYLNNNNSKNIDNNYNLKAIVIHNGGPNIGHYYFYAKNINNNKQFTYIDKIVKLVDLNDAINISFRNKDSNSDEFNKNAYLIIYENVDKDNCEEYEGIQEKLFNNIIPKVY